MTVRPSSTFQACEKPRRSCQVHGLTCVFSIVCSLPVPLSAGGLRPDDVDSVALECCGHPGEIRRLDAVRSLAHSSNGHTELLEERLESRRLVDEQQARGMLACVLKCVRHIRWNRDRRARGAGEGLETVAALHGELVAALENVEELAIGVRVQRRPESWRRSHLETEIGAASFRAPCLVCDVVAAADQNRWPLRRAANDHLLIHTPFSFWSLGYLRRRSSTSVL